MIEIVISENNMLLYLHVISSLRTVENLCPISQKPRPPSNIPGYAPVITKVASAEIKYNQSEKIFGVAIDSQQNFEKHIKNICSKTNAKLGA